MSAANPLRSRLGLGEQTVLAVALRGRDAALATVSRGVGRALLRHASEAQAAADESDAAFLDRALGSHVREGGAEPDRVIWLLSRRELLFKRFDLPLAARENLDWVIRSQLPGHLPVEAERVSLAYAAGESADRKRIAVALFALPGDRLDRLCRAAESIGAAAVAVAPLAETAAWASSARGEGGRSILLIPSEPDLEGVLAVDGRVADSVFGPPSGLSAPLRAWSAGGGTVWRLGEPGAALPLDAQPWRFVSDLAAPLRARPAAALAAMAAERYLGEAGLPLNLLPDALRPRGRFGERQRVRVLAVACVAALMLLGAATLWKAHRRQSALKAELEALRPKMEQAQALRARREKAIERLRAFREAQPPQPRIAWLARLAEVLPADSWLSRIAIEEDRVEMEGYAHRAEALIPLFEKEGLVADPVFNGPVTPGGVHGAEAFRLAGRLTPAATEAGP